MTVVRAVLDTNVVVSALLFSTGTTFRLRRTWRQGRIRPLVSGETTVELLRVLACPKFALNVTDQRELLDDYLPCCETVDMPDARPATPECRDPFDRPFLELALVGRADALVTGDADVQGFADTLAVPVLSPTDFIRQFLDSGTIRIHERG